MMEFYLFRMHVFSKIQKALQKSKASRIKVTSDMGLSRENWEKFKTNFVVEKKKTKHCFFLAAVRRGDFFPRKSHTIIELLKIADPRMLANFFGLEWWYHSRSTDLGGKLNLLFFLLSLLYTI